MRIFQCKLYDTVCPKSKNVKCIIFTYKLAGNLKAGIPCSLHLDWIKFILINKQILNEYFTEV